MPEWDPKKRGAFLAAYSQCGSVTHAARAAKINRGTHYRWLKKYQEYSAAFGEAREEAADALEMEAKRRAVEGIEEPIFYKGEVCGTVRKYSDTLLIFLLKGVRPEKYRDRYQVSGGDKPINFAGYDMSKLAKLTDEELTNLEASLSKLSAGAGRDCGAKRGDPMEGLNPMEAEPQE